MVLITWDSYFKASVRMRWWLCIAGGIFASSSTDIFAVHHSQKTHLLVLRTNMAREDMVKKDLFFIRTVCTCPSHGEAGWSSHVLNANI